MNSQIRGGRFTSSEIHKLIKSGKSDDFSAPGLTYIEETNLERKLNRSLDVDAYSRSMAWGIFLEQYVFSLLPIKYNIVSNQTLIHPTIDYWCGSPDLYIKDELVSDIKCYEPKNFALYTEAILTQSVDVIREDFPKEYWQLVSNAILLNVPHAECIAFMPNYDQLMEIREMAYTYTGADAWKYRFIYETEPEKLSYLPEGSKYEPLNTFVFEVPKEDKDLLTKRVLEAGKRLVSL